MRITVRKSLKHVWGEGLLKMVGGGGGGEFRKTRNYAAFSKTDQEMVSILHIEPESKMEKLKQMKLEIME